MQNCVAAWVELSSEKVLGIVTHGTVTSFCYFFVSWNNPRRLCGTKLDPGRISFLHWQIKDLREIESRDLEVQVAYIPRVEFQVHVFTQPCMPASNLEVTYFCAISFAVETFILRRLWVCPDGLVIFLVSSFGSVAVFLGLVTILIALEV